MRKSVIGLAFVLVAASPIWPKNAQAEDRKVGVLFLHMGNDAEYKFDWYVQFMNNLYDFFAPGFFAGGKLEGKDCYTLIHYASEAEAAVCDVEPGTPIDAMCHVYTEEEEYPIIPLSEEGILGFLFNCSFDAIPAYFMLSSGHSTIAPEGNVIIAPVVTNPHAAGQGIPDFLELLAFSWMDQIYRLPGMRDVHREQAVKWYYGNDAPGYPPDAVELTNIADRLTQAMPGSDFVFRHGWESYMENRDIYGNYAYNAQSTETAVEELIAEGVDRIIVLHTYPSFANLTQYGHNWYDQNGEGVSAIPGRTFEQCVKNHRDGVGPNALELSTYLLRKPWDKHDTHPFPVVKEMVHKNAPDMPIDFAPAYGEFAEFDHAVLESLKYTVDKYDIPKDASLKVILGHHGYFGAYQKAQDCDVYFREVEALFQRVSGTISTGFSWDGPFEVVHGAGEYAEGEYPGADEPSCFKPFGDMWSIGEHIDIAINGLWVNSQGTLVDNGEDNFDYVIVLPYYFETESADTIYGKRLPLGNWTSENGLKFSRDENDADNTPWNAEDLDWENFTVRVMDASGWHSKPRWSKKSVGKGSPTDPTTVIVTGTFLSLGNGPIRDHLTDAAVNAVLSVY